ncbi:MAG: hypothetical protein U0Y08_10940 [Bacteroidia bacterium]
MKKGAACSMLQSRSGLRDQASGFMTQAARCNATNCPVANNLTRLGGNRGPALMSEESKMPKYKVKYQILSTSALKCEESKMPNDGAECQILSTSGLKCEA